MFKYLCILTVCFCLCAANDLRESGRKKGDYLLFGGGLIYYLTFLIIKIKIIAVIGTVITLALVAGKIFAFYKYLTYVDAHHHAEPIYTEALPPTPYFSNEVYLEHPPYEAHDHDHDHHSFDDTPDHPPLSHDKAGYSNYHARKIDNITNIFEMTSKIFRVLKLSELAFDAMHIKSEECKRKFMCEAYTHARDNEILSFGLMILNDTSQDKYRPEKSLSTLEDCQKAYNHCEEIAQS